MTHPENLKESLRDFDDEPQHTANVVEKTPQGKTTEFFHETQHENISPNNNEITAKAQNRTSSWIADLTPAFELDPPVSQSPLHNKSVPKLTLTKFDGDSLKWTDWAGMFYAIIHRSNMTSFEKMTHLQQSVTGRAKSAIASFRYNGNYYHEALWCLENRFGKPHVFVQAHLNKLTKMSSVSENIQIRFRTILKQSTA